MHAALAEAITVGADGDRRAWHRAHAAAAPDENVAAELEASAGRAQARRGLAAAAAFLDRAVALTPDPGRRAQRAVTAARAAHAAAGADAASAMLMAARRGPLDELEDIDGGSHRVARGVRTMAESIWAYALGISLSQPRTNAHRARADSPR